jgi:DNA-binding XRE family transcriptional regulator
VIILGKKIKINKTLREKCGLNQEALALKLGVDRTTVVKWESGGALPRTGMLPVIAKTLQCKIDDLFCS